MTDIEHLELLKTQYVRPRVTVTSGSRNVPLPADAGEAGVAAGLARDGIWLFRHRGTLPFVLLLPLVWSLRSFHYFGGRHELQSLWNWVCLGVSLAGIGIRVSTLGFVPQGTSGRNTRRQRAAGLNTTGWYSVSRNPLYFANFLIGLGFTLTASDLLLVLVYAMSFWLYYERIISTEESFLTDKFGSTFTDWAWRTPVFFPDPRLWRRPALPYCWRTVLRREYSVVLLVGAIFFVIDVLERLLVEQRLGIDGRWLAVLMAAFSIYAVLRTLKKRTRLLHVAGR